MQEQIRNLSNTQSLIPWLEDIALMKFGPASDRDDRQTLCVKWLSTVEMAIDRWTQGHHENRRN